MQEIVCPNCHHGVQSFFTEQYGEEVIVCQTCAGSGKAKSDENGRILYPHDRHPSVNPEKFAIAYIAKLEKINK